MRRNGWECGRVGVWVMCLILLAGCGVDVVKMGKQEIMQKWNDAGLAGRAYRQALAASSRAEVETVRAEQAGKEVEQPSVYRRKVEPKVADAYCYGLLAFASEMEKQRDLYEVILDPLLGLMPGLVASRREERPVMAAWAMAAVHVMTTGA